MNIFAALQSKKILLLALALGATAALLLAFAAGMTVGYQKALFASRWGRNYYQNFYGGPDGFLHELTERGPGNMHGTVGFVMSVSSTTIAVKDLQNNEQSIAILPSTVIRMRRGDAAPTDIRVGDAVAIIGAPNGNGQIAAQFIRVFPTTSLPFAPFLPEPSGPPQP